MPVYTLERRQSVAIPHEHCWRFFSDPRNLAKITPPALRFTVLSELPHEIHPGLMIRYRVSPIANVPLTWVTEITHVRAPDYFVDEQRVGPYALWHHEHSFRALDAGTTEVHDLVHYVPPLGPLGAILNRMVIRRQLEQIFNFRERQLVTITAGGSGDSFA